MKFIIVGYRDSYFWNDFGTSVRDLQIAEILSRNYEVIFINRPVSIYERILHKKKCNAVYKKYSERIKFIDTTSYDPFGPLKGRLWTEKCYQNIFDKVLKNHLQNRDGKKIIVIDFTPLAKLNYKKDENVYYWYDLIDNFQIHNRFSIQEKLVVEEKYKYVNENADIITGVSNKALDFFTVGRKFVMPNGVYFESNEDANFTLAPNHQYFQLGFVGFITDKFDIEFVNKLAEKYSIIIWGKFFDETIIKKLHSSIKIAGPFRYSNLPVIMKTFKIGLLPYLPAKSHDESPLKMYEYFKHGIPCLSSMDFEIDSVWFVNYLKLKQEELYSMINHYLELENSEDIISSIKDDWVFDYKINEILKKIEMN